jgi:hypothetical protein
LNWEARDLILGLTLPLKDFSDLGFTNDYFGSSVTSSVKWEGNYDTHVYLAGEVLCRQVSVVKMM